MGMSAFYKGFESDEAQSEAMRVFDKAVEHEHFMLDTSDIYGPFTNEELISSCLIYQFQCTTASCLSEKATDDKKGKFKIATKCGIILSPDGGSLNSTAEHVKKSCQGQHPVAPAIRQLLLNRFVGSPGNRLHRSLLPASLRQADSYRRDDGRI